MKIPARIIFLFKCFISGIAIFTFLRLVLFIIHYGETTSIPSTVIFQSFIMGLRFDVVVSGYILALPLVIYLFAAVFSSNRRIIDSIVWIWITILYSLAFIICCSDIQWFNHQQTRLTVAALEWTESPGMMFGIIFGDAYNYPFLILLIAYIIGYYLITRKFYRKLIRNNIVQINFPLLGTYLIACGLLFLGIRGRVEMKSPIRWGTAFTSEYNFTNQLGLNPVYTFLQSAIDAGNVNNKSVEFMNADSANIYLKNFYKSDNDHSPVARNINGINPKKYNIVLVLMESMTAYNMNAFGNKENLTPNLDSLYNNSIVFPNFYSDGIHTFCGVYSSLTGFPSLPNHHHMKDLKNQQPYGGIASTLSEKGYETFFFTTHDDQFDNMGGFLSPIGYKHLISQKDYPKEKILNTLGVPDHILFEEVINHINQYHHPFFSAVLTASNHGPYEIPPGISFKPHSDDLRKQLIEYADWSVGQFIKSSSTQPWFDSTIFIFTGDHGALVNGIDNTVSYHRIPFIIYALKLFSPSVKENVGGQVDIYATVMGLLDESYLNNSFGVDLFRTDRKWITFSYDDEYGAVGKNYYCVKRKDGEVLFSIDDNKINTSMVADKAKLDSMMGFTNAVFQGVEGMIEGRRMK